MSCNKPNDTQILRKSKPILKSSIHNVIFSRYFVRATNNKNVPRFSVYEKNNTMCDQTPTFFLEVENNNYK